jgi:hypothetical protein
MPDRNTLYPNDLRDGKRPSTRRGTRAEHTSASGSKLTIFTPELARCQLTLIS